MNEDFATNSQYKEAKKILGNLHHNYSNAQYQKITNDLSFDNVPEKLWELWYQPYNKTNLSLYNADYRLHNIVYTSDVEDVISNFKDLEEELANQFNKLQ